MDLLKSLLFCIVLLLILSFIPVSGTIKGSTKVFDDNSPNYIFYNGHVLTMEPNPSNVEAVAVQGDSISTVGKSTAIFPLADTDTVFIDLEGKTLLPGFIDSHSHWLGDRHLLNISDPNEIIEILVRNGWTSISELFVDGGWHQGRLDELRLLDQQGNLTVRVNAYLPLNYGFDRFGTWYQDYQQGYEFSPNLRIGGVKLFMDRWYTQWMPFFDQAELETLMQEAHDLGYQIAIHSVMNNATDVVLNAFETVLAGESNEKYRHRIEHLVLLRDDQIHRMKELKILASIQIAWINSDWTTSESYPYLENYTHLAGRWRDIVEAGVPTIGSTDFPYNHWNMRSPLQQMALAVTRIGNQGLQPPEWMVNQTLSVEQALRLLTIEGAYGTFQEDIKGSIKEGKLADLVILSDNPFTVAESEIKDIEVLMTMIGGEIEYSSPDSPIKMETRVITRTTSTTVSELTASFSIGMSLIPLIILGNVIKKRKK